MKVHHRHDWNVTPPQAIALQKQLVSELVLNRPIALDTVKLVAGVDVSVKNDISHAAVVVLSFPDLQPVETVTATLPTPFPYIPGLLSFREGPVLEHALEQLQHEPDAFIFDGMGIAHPRRIGIAAHMGLWLQKPTVGCGKTLLVGHYTEPADERGAYSDLVDRNQRIGVVLRTRQGTKPVFISPGNLADIPSSVELVMACTTKYRLPEPIRAAHNAAGDF
ncbi:MAG: endonuclease V [Chloroflexi bacterium]|nr:endonuclease V [Chloroflexota bacterium]